ncbi:GCN5 family acetyltransferase [Flavobacterium pallidum]|uniref:GCN5 family acetyltransferase n=1 Tax=Flavobacterium pallidum TaxID=2172098 RepID=A0A2S1SKE0_9FLAO|nr:GCN5 family acetyltransferase [Flavobacterium pallidum]AWI26832.1 GCN5 family acetyltransferase [Flavobacterium pallidum]
MNQYPKVNRIDEIGNYPALVPAGGGYVWDEVLEYRVWCHSENGAEDFYDGDDYYYSFATFEEAEQFSQSTNGAESPIALILQKEYIEESEPGKYLHIKEERITEWPVEFLSRPQRNQNTITNFLNADPFSNRLDILRGKV